MDFDIGNRIKERMDEINENAGKRVITVRKIAKTAEVSEDYVWRIMRGDRNPSQKVQFKLAKVLKTDIDHLFFIKEKDNKSIKYREKRQGGDKHGIVK